MLEKFLQSFRAARRVGTSLIGISTPDPAATIARCVGASAKTTPAFGWDSIRGLRPLNDPARAAMADVMGGAEPEAVTLDPTGVLAEFAPKLPELSVLYLMGVSRYLSDTTADGAKYAQAIWNLRDPYKIDTRTLVLLGPALTIPAEIRNDVVLLDEPLPDDTELGEVVTKLLKNAEVPFDAEVRDRTVDAVRGLAAYPAEQAVAMNTTPKKPLDVRGVWERKCKMIEQTKGLSVWRGTERFADIGGVEQAKKFFRMLMDGRDRFKVNVFMDEMEKQMAGAGGRANDGGVAEAQHGALLTYLQDRNVEGVRLVGVRGGGKSAIGKAVGNEANVLTIVLNVGESKNSFVGASEENMAMLLKVIEAVGGENALWIGTCNRDDTLTPEFKRRFPTVFYFDLPTEEERAMIWPIYRTKYELGTAKENPAPADDGWTGAEIRQAARLAYKLKIPLKETAQFIIPIKVSDAEAIEVMRRQADRKILSASHPGVYVMPSTAERDRAVAEVVAKRGRTISDREV